MFSKLNENHYDLPRDEAGNFLDWQKSQNISVMIHTECLPNIIMDYHVSVKPVRFKLYQALSYSNSPEEHLFYPESE
jgi:hypothetical protein